MEKIQKIDTHFYNPIAIEIWNKGLMDGFRKTIGLPFSDFIVKFDGRKMEMFRVESDLDGLIKEEILRYVKKRKFYNKIDAYKKDVDNYYKALIEGNDLEKIIKMFVKIYPVMEISSLVSSLWRSDLNFFNKKSEVLLACRKYTKLSEGTFSRLIAFIDKYIERRNFSLFTTLNDIEDGTEARDWMSDNFIFSKGSFVSLSWNDFLSRSEYSFNDNKMEGVNINSRKIIGNGVFKGTAKGVVKIIFSPFEIEEIKKGDILVTSMTQSEFSPVFKKINGIITDEGGVTCHAITMAGEIKKPCVINTKFATEFLNDGDEVEMDGGKGVVKITKRKRQTKKKGVVSKNNSGFLTELIDSKPLKVKTDINDKVNYSKIKDEKIEALKEMRGDENIVKLKVEKNNIINNDDEPEEIDDSKEEVSEPIHLKISNIEDNADFTLNQKIEDNKREEIVKIKEEEVLVKKERVHLKIKEAGEESGKVVEEKVKEKNKEEVEEKIELNIKEIKEEEIEEKIEKKEVKEKMKLEIKEKNDDVLDLHNKNTKIKIREKVEIKNRVEEEKIVEEKIVEEKIEEEKVNVSPIVDIRKKKKTRYEEVLSDRSSFADKLNQITKDKNEDNEK